MEELPSSLKPKHQKESDFWSLIKRSLGDHSSRFWRIEDSAGSGTLDVIGCRMGRVAWVELKVAKGNRLYFRMAQRPWIANWINVEGSAYVLARKDDAIFLWHAQSVLDAESTPYAERKAFSVTLAAMGEPLVMTEKPFNWPLINAAIFAQ